jgi:membrane protein DedA with SNARE-associated domain
MDLAHILDLIRQHGQAVYAFIFAYAASHGMIMALFAGYAAQTGALDVVTVLFACWTGSFIGDTIRFWVGRRFGTSWLRSWPRLESGLRKAARLVDRHYLWLPLVHRYPNGIRNLAGFAFGMSNLSWPSFLALNFVAAGLWAGLTVFAGYAFGQISDKAMNDAASHVSLALLVVFLAAAWLLSKRLDRAIERS